MAWIRLRVCENFFWLSNENVSLTMPLPFRTLHLPFAGGKQSAKTEIETEKYKKENPFDFVVRQMLTNFHGTSHFRPC